MNLLVFLDISVVFDTIDRGVLLEQPKEVEAGGNVSL